MQGPMGVSRPLTTCPASRSPSTPLRGCAGDGNSVGEGKRDQLTETWCFKFHYYPNILQMQKWVQMV